MKKLREWLLLDEWFGLLVRHIRFRRLRKEIYRCMRCKIKYEVSKQFVDSLHEDFCKRYPNSPLNKRNT